MMSRKVLKRPGVSEKVALDGINWTAVCLGILVSVSIAGLLLCTGGSLWNLTGTDQDELIMQGSIHGSPVNRQKYDKRKSYKEIAEEREPIILTGTVVERWPARKLFTTSFLASKIKHFMAHRQEHKGTFITFHNSKPLEPYVSEKWKEFNIKVNTTIPQVLQWDSHHHNSNGPFLYYTQDMATLRSQFPDVIGYIQPISDLILHSEDKAQVNLWVGRKGIITHTHYDCTYNFFFQLQGRKRFTLFPPNQTLYLYPCLHPHYGHSQVDIKEPDYMKYPLFKSTSPIVAEVRPGDMLVVPPFWYHHVETLSESVSVNVWSDAPEYALINDVYSLPIPFEEDWDLESMVKATKIYIEMVLSALGIEDVSSFITDLLSQRYDILIARGQLRLNTEVPVTLCRDIDWVVARRQFKPLLKHGVDSVTNVLMKIPVRATLEICLGNYVEHLVSQVLGIDLLYPFLKQYSQPSACKIVSQ